MTDVPAQQDGQPSKAKVFISYSRKDIAFADRLDAALKVRGFEPLIDRTDIYAFEEWWKRVEDLIVRADTIIFVLSPDAVKPDTVALKEVAFAASLNKRFAPIVFRPVQDKDVPGALAKLNFIFFDDPARFEQSADKLVEALNTDISWIRQHTDFGEQARRWALAKGPTGLLLRSPLLDQAERWIASRPPGAPAPTDETQTFIRRSRQGATRRRNVLTGSLAAGLVLALALAGLAYWQRGVAIEQRTIAQHNEAQAKEERDRATRNFQLAQKTAESLVFDIAQGLRDVQGMRAETVRKILETAQATFEQLVASAPDDPALQRSRAAMLDEFGDTYLVLGDLQQARSAYQDGFRIRERLSAAEPNDTDWKRDLAVSYEKMGDVLLALGDLNEALKNYKNCLLVREALAVTDPANTPWQRELSIAHERVGAALEAQGNLDAALAEYRKGLAISEKLAGSNPNNPSLQSDLSISYDRVGNVLVDQGNLNEALMAYRNSLAIRQRLAAFDPSIMNWQRDLALSYDKIADVLAAQGKLDDALQSYRDSFTIKERLAKADPGNTQWQRDLSLSYDRIGNILFAQKRLDDALKSYREALAIRERLTAADPTNSGWQRDLSVSYDKVGGVLVAQGKLEEALKARSEALAIRERLTAADPSNGGWKRDLWTSYILIGEVFDAQGKRDDALKMYREALIVMKGLAASDPSNAGWQRDLALSHYRLSDLFEEQQNLDEALRELREGVAISERLATSDPTNTLWQEDRSISISTLGRIAYKLVLARHFSMALEAADQSIALAPEKIWLYSNRAHALMFLNRVDEARALYLKYRGAKNVTDNKSWENVIPEDFAELRKAGLTHSLMDEVEKTLTAGG